MLGPNGVSPQHITSTSVGWRTPNRAQVADECVLLAPNGVSPNNNTSRARVWNGGNRPEEPRTVTVERVLLGTNGVSSKRKHITSTSVAWPPKGAKCGVADNETSKVAFGWGLLAPNGVSPPPPATHPHNKSLVWGSRHQTTHPRNISLVWDAPHQTQHISPSRLRWWLRHVSPPRDISLVWYPPHNTSLVWAGRHLLGHKNTSRVYVLLGRRVFHPIATAG